MRAKCIIIICSILICMAIGGCAPDKEKIEKVNDLDYTVLAEADWPETLKELIEERKMKPFNLNYSEGEFMYICVGYGEQQSGGYSIQVDDFYEGEEVLYINTTLLGPSEQEQSQEQAQDNKSYPVIVLKTEYLDKTVVFE